MLDDLLYLSNMSAPMTNNLPPDPGCTPEVPLINEQSFPLIGQNIDSETNQEPTNYVIKYGKCNIW